MNSDTQTVECTWCDTEIVVDEYGRVVEGEMYPPAPPHLVVCSEECFARHTHADRKRILAEMSDEVINA